MTTLLSHNLQVDFVSRRQKHWRSRRSNFRLKEQLHALAGYCSVVFFSFLSTSSIMAARIGYYQQLFNSVLSSELCFFFFFI